MSGIGREFGGIGPRALPSALKQPPEPPLLRVSLWMIPHPCLAPGAGGEFTGQLNPQGHEGIGLWQVVSELCVS